LLWYVQGILKECHAEFIVIEVAGFALQAWIPASFYFELPAPGEKVTVFTCFYIKDDEPVLYGFKERQERDFFRMLTAISGIGPRAALSLLGHLPLQQLSGAIMAEDTAMLTRIPGIGSKTARRLVYELKEKITSGQLEHVLPAAAEKETSAWLEVQQALLALGYSLPEVSRAGKALEKEQFTAVEELFKRALSILART